MRFILLGAAGLLVSSAALAQAPVYDPEQLPAFKGKIAAYSLGSRDELDGLILEDGTEVHISSRLSSELAFAVKPGDSVTVHGLKASAGPIVQALSIAQHNAASPWERKKSTTPSSQRHAGPSAVHAPRMMEARGRVEPLHAPDGR